MLYACLNAGLVFVGAILARRVFTVCGSLGVFGYLGYLSYSVFKDSLALVVSGIWWQRHEARIRAHFRGFLPNGLRESLASAG